MTCPLGQLEELASIMDVISLMSSSRRSLTCWGVLQQEQEQAVSEFIHPPGSYPSGTGLGENILSIGTSFRPNIPRQILPVQALLLPHFMNIEGRQPFVVPIVPFLKIARNLDIWFSGLAPKMRRGRPFLARVPVVKVLLVLDAESEDLNGADRDFSGGAVSIDDISAMASPATILSTRFMDLGRC